MNITHRNKTTVFHFPVTATGIEQSNLLITAFKVLKKKPLVALCNAMIAVTIHDEWINPQDLNNITINIQKVK